MVNVFYQVFIFKNEFVLVYWVGLLECKELKVVLVVYKVEVLDFLMYINGEWVIIGE